MMPPVRTTGSLFGVTANSTVPLPCPERPAVMLSQASLASAVHGHSRSVLTRIAPVPPLAGKGAAGASKVTAHLVIVAGDVNVLTDEPQPASATAPRSTTVLRRNRREIEPPSDMCEN